MKENGKLIVICGIDGSGKETLAKNIYEYLQKKDILTKVTKQPTDFFATMNILENFSILESVIFQKKPLHF